MARFEDKSGVGRSNLVPFIPGESFRKRHHRRLETNLEMLPAFQEWCAQHDLKVEVTNDGHHWRIYGPKLFCEWWPSSAKLVFAKNYRKGIHCHDIEQVSKLILTKV